jgi:hypothetical protein
MDKTTYTNSTTGKQVLSYYSPKSVVLNLPFILTLNKELKIGMPYMLLENNHTKAIRLLNVRDADGIVYLNVQELQTLKTYTLSWNMEYDGDYWLWCLADFESLFDLTK